MKSSITKTAACSLTIAILLVALSISKASLLLDAVLLGALCVTFVCMIMIEKKDQ